MKQLKLFVYLAICSIVLFMSSCLTPEENKSILEDVNGSIMSRISASVSVSSPWKITRASSDEVPLPIRYYLFSEAGECISMKLVEDASNSAEFSVSRGVYTLYALCGNVTNAPSAADASEETLLPLAANTDVCLGNASITVDKYGVSYPVKVTASHLFSMVSLALSDVPESVEEIYAEFGDLYSSVSLSGEYGGSNVVDAYFEQDKTKSGVWNLPLMYMYPSKSANMPITMTIKSEDETIQTIETTTEHVSKKGVKLSLNAEFKSISTVMPGGVEIGNGWEETSKDIDLWGDGNTTTQIQPDVPTNNESTEETTVPSDNVVYHVGEQYKDTKAIILSVTDKDNNTLDLLLFGTHLLCGNPSTIEAGLVNYNQKIGVDKISGTNKWRLPSPEELELLRKKYSASELLTRINEVYGITQPSFVASDSFLTNNSFAFTYDFGTAIYAESSNNNYCCLPMIIITISK